MGGASAPIIFADEVTTWGVHDGVAYITLEADRHMVLPSGLRSDRVVVAHLRLAQTAHETLKKIIATIDAQHQAARKRAN